MLFLCNAITTLQWELNFPSLGARDGSDFKGKTLFEDLKSSSCCRETKLNSAV